MFPLYTGPWQLRSVIKMNKTKAEAKIDKWNRVGETEMVLTKTKWKFKLNS